MSSTVFEDVTVSDAGDAAPEPREVTVIEAGRRGGHDVGFRRALTLAWTLALTDWKLRFYGSALGAVWTLARPFAFFGVIYFVFTTIIGLSKDVPHYGVYILFSLVLFTFFSEITGNSVQALTVRENLLRKMYFPPLVIPMAVSITALLNLGMTLIAVLVFVLANGIYPAWGWLELPPLVLFITVFASGLGMLLSSLYVRFRDIQPIWEVVAQMLFYATPVLYVSTAIPDKYQRLLLCNPLAAAFTQVRHSIVDGRSPSIVHAFGDNFRVLVPLGIALLTFVIGYLVFRRESPRIAENL